MLQQQQLDVSVVESIKSFVANAFFALVTKPDDLILLVWILFFQHELTPNYVYCTYLIGIIIWN